MNIERFQEEEGNTLTKFVRIDGKLYGVTGEVTEKLPRERLDQALDQAIDNTVIFYKKAKLNL